MQAQTGGTGLNRFGRALGSLWLLARFVLCAVAGIIVLVMAFAVQHRQTFLVDDDDVETPYIDISEAVREANQLGDALLERNWLKVERFLAPDTADRDYIENFQLDPTVRTLASSDCSSKEISSTNVTPPPAQSTEFLVRLMMSRMCVTSAEPFNSIEFRMQPRGSDWFYIISTIRLERP